jgi:hypothetical protein
VIPRVLTGALAVWTALMLLCAIGGSLTLECKFTPGSTTCPSGFAVLVWAVFLAIWFVGALVILVGALVTALIWRWLGPDGIGGSE